MQVFMHFYHYLYLYSIVLINIHSNRGSLYQRGTNMTHMLHVNIALIYYYHWEQYQSYAYVKKFYIMWQDILWFQKILMIWNSSILQQTRNTVSNAHKMIPPASPCFVWQSLCFAQGHPKIMRIRILNRRCSMALCSKQFLKVSWNSVQLS